MRPQFRNEIQKTRGVEGPLLTTLFHLKLYFSIYNKFKRVVYHQRGQPTGQKGGKNKTGTKVGRVAPAGNLFYSSFRSESNYSAIVVLY